MADAAVTALVGAALVLGCSRDESAGQPSQSAPPSLATATESSAAPRPDGKDLSQLPLRTVEATWEATTPPVTFQLSLPERAKRTSTIPAWEICRTELPAAPGQVRTRPCASIIVSMYAKSYTRTRLDEAAQGSHIAQGGQRQSSTIRDLPDGHLITKVEDDRSLVSVKRFLQLDTSDLVCSYSERAHAGIPAYEATIAWAEQLCLSLIVMPNGTP